MNCNCTTLYSIDVLYCIGYIYTTLYSVSVPTQHSHTLHQATLHYIVIYSSTVQPEFLPSSQAVRAVATTDMEKLTRAADYRLEEA